MSEPDIAALRRDYTLRGLRRAELAVEPLEQFRKWFAEALVSQHEANAMNLATANSDGCPAARIVLMKGCDERGLVFFTNYESAKGRDLAENARASALFFWDKLERQVRLNGRIEKTSRAESEGYFHSRPRGSQLGAWASQQSARVENREELENCLAEMDAKFAGKEIPLPENWGGYRLVPTTWEFWQGRQNRLHDRFLYRREAAGSWEIERLAP